MGTEAQAKCDNLKIIVYTQAYNAEKTLARAMDSILAQTYRDFTYIVLDNASSDSTGQIISEYAQRDSRVIARRYDVNDRHSYVDIARECGKSHEHGYLAFLDADDEYDPRFLEKMITFAEENNLDVASCSGYYVTNENKMFEDLPCFGHTVIVETSDPAKLKYTETQLKSWWCKLFSFSTLSKCQFKRVKDTLVWSDFIFTTEAYINAQRIGMLADRLFRYYYTSGSWMRESNVHCYSTDTSIYHDIKLDFYHKYNAISHKGFFDFWRPHIAKYIALFIKGNCFTLDHKIQAILEALTLRYTLMDIYLTEGSKQAYIAAIISGLKELNNADALKCLFAIRFNLTDNKAPMMFDDAKLAETTSKLLEPRQEPVAYIVQGIKVSCDTLRKNLKEELDSVLLQIISISPLLAQISADGTFYMHKIVTNIIDNRFDAALDEALLLLDGKIPNEYAEEFLTLAQNIAAVTESTPVYIYLKKVLVSYLIDCSRFAEAKTELDEYANILPHDEDFAELKNRLDNESIQCLTTGG